MSFRISNHAYHEMQRRGIPDSVVQEVTGRPQQVIPEGEGKNIYQSKIDFGTGKVYLVRIIVSEETEPPTVITLYRTSKIAKYWRLP